MSDSSQRSGLSPLKRALLALDEMKARLDAAEKRHLEPLALVGIGCRLPGAVDGPESFWRFLQDGVDAIREVPAERWDTATVYDPDPDAPGKAYTRWGGFLDRVDGFDPQLFGIAPREAPNIDPQHRLLLEVTWEALEHAGQAPDRLTGSRTGVFLGICGGDYKHLSPSTHDPSQINPYSASGTAHSVAAGRLSYTLGLQGPAISVDTACSSSLVALHLACQSLRAGECRLALAGGVSLMLAPDNTILFCKNKAMSPTGRCRTFGAGADGFVFGEGSAMVVLKRLSDALADGDRIVAVVRGSAINQDGASGGLTVPNGPAQEAVIRDALASAGMEPAEVGYVEAHGTGTTLGDPIEVRALAGALGPGRPRERPLLIGSVKTNFGHLEAAAGVAGFVKAALAVERGEIPPHLHAEELNPRLPWDELPVSVVRRDSRWPEGQRRAAGVSSFGFSGTNAHVILEEPPKAAPVTTAAERPVHLLAFSGGSEDAVRAVADRYGRHLETHPGDAAVDVAFSANTGRAHLSHRRAVAFAAGDELRRRLAALSSGEVPEGTHAGALEGSDRPRVVFLFTGHGTLYRGMGRRLYETQPTFRRALDSSQEVLRSEIDRPLLDILFRDEGSLPQMAYGQPALFAFEHALAQMWRSWGIEPAAVLGHSSGEFVAACLAGVFSFEDGLRLTAARGRLMQSLPPGGVMVAVQADEDRVRGAIAPFAGRVDLAGVNAPTSLVISGAREEVAQACSALEAEGLKTRPLAVSHASHSSLMEPILDEFRQIADGISLSPPALPLVSNVTGEAFKAGETPDAAYWARHLREPVRFLKSVEWLYQKGYRVFLEVGPSPTLSGLGALCLPDEDCLWLPSLGEDRDDWETLLGSLATLYVHGARVDWAGFDHDYPRRKATLPTYPFQRKRYWFSEASARAAASRPDPDAHPLLGRRVHAAGLSDVVFEQTLSAAVPEFVADHRVHETVVFPGTGYLEMGLAAGRDQLGDLPSLEDVTIREALVLREDEPRVVQVVVSREDDVRVFRVFSRVAGDEVSWKLHAEGRIVPDPDHGPGLPAPAEALARCGSAQDGPAFYAALDARGLTYGTRFRGVSEISRGEGEAVARVAAPQAVGQALGRYELHPALLDACVQTLAGAAPEGADQPVFMPIGMATVRLLGRPGPRLLVHATMRPGGSEDTLTGQVLVHNEDDGTPVALLAGIAVKQTDAETLARVGAASDVEGLLYELEWEAHPLEKRSPPRIPLDRLATALDSRLAELGAEHGFGVSTEVESGLESLVGVYVLETLEALGWAWRDGARQDVEGLAERLGVIPRHRRTFARLVDVVVDQGFLKRVGPAWEPAGCEPPGAAASMAEELLARYPSFKGEVTVTRRCGARLAEVLRGQEDPLQLLFPGGSTETAEDLYARSPSALVHNSLAGEALAAVAPDAGPLRILEIGAGTGGTTARLLPSLPADRTDYLFTDVSPLFASRAEESFGDCPFLRTGVLDIEKDPSSQGFEDGTFDVVVAANVLHATSDLRETLGHVRRLLAPGGALVLFEVTRPQAWVDLTFGLTEGWWRFADTDLRPSYPLLSRANWTRLLVEEAGFSEAVAVPGATESGEPAQAVLVARAPQGQEPRDAADTAERPEVDWLVLADEGGTADSLAERLRRRGETVVIVRPGDGFARDDDGYTVDPTSPAQTRRLFDEAGSVGAVVHLLALDAVSPSDTTPDSLRDDQGAVCGSALNIVQALAGRSGRPPRLFVVTRGGQPVEGPLLAPAQSTLWGLGKVIALEHPEVGCRCIDLAPGGQGGEIDSLVTELVVDDGEREVALRPAGRFVPRLVSAADRARQEPALPPCWELGIESRGTLDNLEIRSASRRPPGRGEVEIETRAIGLNFRDVLSALGLYPGAPPPLGSECSGRVTRVGDGVDGLGVGDDVIAMSPGVLRTHVVAEETLVVRKPPALSFEEAATLAIPFVTAWFCLRHVAGLARGERVLIHAAAGGVGLAAVQIAQMIGAEVLATAGSPEKREFLAARGVEHVMDSRSLAFAEGVRAATGGRGVDVVLNSLAGEFVEASLGVTAEGGRFVEIGKREIWEPARVEQERPDVGYTVVDLGETGRKEPTVLRSILEEVVDLVSRGALRPLPGRVFRAGAVVDAFRYMAQGRHLGKVIVAPEPPPEPEPSIRDDRTYLVTGGLSGIGLLSADWLASRGARHLALLGRRDPDETAKLKIAQMEEAGARVRVFSADVADRARMTEVIRELAAAPPLGGVIHAAGLVDDGVLTQMDWPRFARVLAPKVEGSWILHDLTREQPLDFFVLYSSVVSLLGSPGQANHVAASAFLDALAHYRRASGLPAVSLNWGAWKDVGAAARVGSGVRVSLQGLSGFSASEGLEVLGRLLEPRAAQVGVARVEWPRFLERYGDDVPPVFSRAPRPGSSPVPSGRDRQPDLRKRLAATAPGSREAVLRAHVREQALRVLGLDASSGLDPRRPLQEMGLDSLMAVELRNVLGKALGQTLPATLLFDHPTAEALVTYLAGSVLELGGEEEPAETDRTPPSTVVDAIEDLSDEEVERRLAEKMKQAER